MGRDSMLGGGVPEEGDDPDQTLDPLFAPTRVGQNLNIGGG